MAAAKQQQKGHTLLIIDCDAGTDDAQAILMALAHSDSVELLAVTTVMGNSIVENTTRNAVRILRWAGRTDIPVYAGATYSLIGTSTPNDGFHGRDGLGDVTLEGVDPVDVGEVVGAESAPSAICRIVAQHPGSVTLLAIGPLTNVATALTLDPRLGEKLKEFVVMGGNTNGLGNITATAEFNFYCDPEAAQCVLARIAPCAVTLLTLNTCLEFSFEWDWYEALMSRPTRTAAFLRAIDACSARSMRSYNAPVYWAWDQLAMAVILRPDAVLRTSDVTAAVELKGELTRGQMVVGKGVPGGAPNVRLVEKVDMGVYEGLILNMVDYDFSKK